MRHRPFTFLDLFAGAGGFTLGLNQAGGDLRSIAIEWNADCADTLRLNFPEANVIEADVRGVEFDLGHVDVVVAGPPCQGFSTLNRRKGADPRNLLYAEVLRCVAATRPSIVVVENVAKFAQSDEAGQLAAALTSEGFTVRTNVVNAADFGVPQRRLRTLVVATAPGTPLVTPAPTHEPRGERLAPHRTVADAFALLPTEPDGRNWHRDLYTQRTTHLERLRVIPEGGGRKDLPPDLVLECWRNTEGFSDVLGRLEWHKPATTIRTEFFRPEKGRFLHPVADRPITPREAARLQSFPDRFLFPEEQTLTSVGRQIGNAIPPRLAQAIGDAIVRAFENRTARETALAS